MKKHLLWFMLMVTVMVGTGAGAGCGDLEANDSPGAPVETAAAPLVAETAPRESIAASRDSSPPAEVDPTQPSVAAAASHTCGACVLDQGVNGRGNFKGVRSCCWNVPVVDENGRISHICVPYQQDCGASWSSPPAAM